MSLERHRQIQLFVRTFSIKRRWHISHGLSWTFCILRNLKTSSKESMSRQFCELISSSPTRGAGTCELCTNRRSRTHHGTSLLCCTTLGAESSMHFCTCCPELHALSWNFCTVRSSEVFVEIIVLSCGTCLMCNVRARDRKEYGPGSVRTILHPFVYRHQPDYR